MQSLEDLEREFLEILNKPIEKAIKKVYTNTKPKEHKEVLNDMEKELEEIKKYETEKFLRKLNKRFKKVLEIDDKIKESESKIKSKKIQIEKSTDEFNNLVYSGKYDSKVKPLKSYFIEKKDFTIEKGKKKKINFGNKSYMQSFNPSDDLEISDKNLPLISRRIFRIYKNYKREIKAIHRQGVEYVMKVFFKFYDEDESGKVNYISKVFRKHQSIQSISRVIKQELIDKFIQGYLVPVLSHIDFFVFPLNNAGGCSSCYTSKGKTTYQNSTVKLISPKSSGNNCLFMCFVSSLNLKGNDYNFKNIRKELKLSESDEINFKDVGKVSNYFGCGYVLLNQKQEIISYKDLINKPKVHIMLMNSHYYMCREHNLIQCKQCGRKHYSDTKHECNNKMITYYNKKIMKKSEYVDMINSKEKNKISDDSMIFFDLETFQESNFHIPYAIGYTTGKDKNIKISYGKNCTKDFIDYLLTVSNKSICAYNGSGFDFYILLNLLKDRNIDIKNIINSNGSILYFEFGNKNKVFDLYRFINSSLSKACEDYNIENKKMKFDVLKIQSWELAQKYRTEVEPYLKYDVLSLSELFFKFNDDIYNLEQVNITRFTTLSHMSYCLWTSELEDLIELPNIEKYDFIKKATYGARCMPNQQLYKSKHYDDVINKKMTYEELKKTKDYIFNADATSLYPASMCGYELLETTYPTGQSRWSNEPEKEYQNNKIGFYEIEYICPKDLIVPILPRKTINGGLEWSLLDGEGVYTNIDIFNAKRQGYTIVFKNRCLVYDTNANVFKKFINKFYKMKEEAEKENNDVKRNIAKLILNSMYGKTLQKAIYTNTQIINNYKELMDFFSNYDITDISNLDDNRLIMTGEYLDKEKRISKPCQLGAFVLSYSRSIMLIYMRAIDPELKTHIFTYTDTDSLHILGQHAEKLYQLGYIKSKEESKLGFLCSDIKKEGIIISEINLAPKCYTYEYINNSDQLKLNENSTMKSKGIPLRCLNYEMYSNYKNEEQICEFSGLRRKHTNLTKSDIDKELPFFSIVNNSQRRTFMKNNWGGMILKNNMYFPKGFNF